ncbi:carboxymuconolactone decarboxylase family protein [Streptomyces sp. V4-01]|uniref:Carboxymuconolactone decarboxylase family protein n=1 Tax=Actinacidiphila polyblastidii TaxID=3110430 RepID=A0ABU7PKK7_9ACTN|nr:carboxymuconolactone decarboxylase family protein [Streptomyces sp. V4-01]
MPHIELGNDQPGIRSLFFFRPETAGPLCDLVEVLLRAPSTLQRWERELIATRVSGLNECRYCTTTHAAFACAQLPEDVKLDLVRADVIADPGIVGADILAAPISDKLRALLAIAEAVQRSGRDVTPELVEQARAQGATDVELHDTVLIAAAFCMYNRYVDGLDTIAPQDPENYTKRAEALAQDGYLPIVDAALAHQAAARG